MPPGTIHSVVTVAQCEENPRPIAEEPAAVATGSHFFCYSTMEQTLLAAFRHRVYNNWANTEHPEVELMAGCILLLVLQILEGKANSSNPELPLSDRDLAALIVLVRHTTKFDQPGVKINPESHFGIQRGITVHHVVPQVVQRLTARQKDVLREVETRFLGLWDAQRDFLPTERAAVGLAVKKYTGSNATSRASTKRRRFPEEDM